MRHRKVGIVTWYCTPNYGSQLQAFALSRILNKLGFQAVFINFTKYPLIKTFLSFFPNTILRLLKDYYASPQYNFTRSFLKEYYVNPKGILTSDKMFSAVICGSDQIWAPNIYNPVYMLSFISEKTKKLSYAASIGLNAIPVALIDDYKHYIGRLNFVSVREEKARDILIKQCGIDAQVVLDPTLLISIDDWRKIELKCNITRPYLFCYFLNSNNNYKEAVIEYARKNDLEIYGFSSNPNDYYWISKYHKCTIDVREFLGLIDGANIIFTDSYHGTIFSLLFHKEFISIKRFSDNDEICQNSRIYQLDKYFHISNQIVEIKEGIDMIPQKIDYEAFDKSLCSLRNQSLDFLTKSLS